MAASRDTPSKKSAIVVPESLARAIQTLETELEAAGGENYAYTILVRGHVVGSSHRVLGRVVPDFVATPRTPKFIALAEDLRQLGETIAEADISDYCDECLIKYPEEAHGMQGPWHAERCSLYAATVVRARYNPHGPKTGRSSH